ncbi:hypothetical protein HELRODRAFT_188577 [Helobdella robusta]|uniref:SOCS box domain-containing protein n=1 Tax=Helobdella robusta TaxID=6412 RepID=T1FQ52_HELRO|nr:hypothetical protein HELRODRAFT_188577 [Helobdella robusta]ESO02107.1 hypothetical protein HELRODRAFT_188577 [Helobdella robusta]
MNMKNEHIKLIMVITASSVLAVALVLSIAFTSIFIVSLLRSTFAFIIAIIHFITEVITAIVAAITSGLTITCSIIVAVSTAAFILPASKIKGRVFVSFLIASTSTASYISAIFIFTAPKMGTEVATAVVMAAASSVAFAAAWAVGIMVGSKHVFEMVRRNNHRMLRIILKFNVCIRQKDLDVGLLYSSKIGYQECFEHLLEAGANPNVVDSYENTPLAMSCELGNDQMVEMLIAKGANIEAKSGGGRGTALHRASNWGYEKCVNILLKYGATPHARDASNRTPLMLACIHAPDVDKIVKVLLNAGSDVNAISNDFKTALHYACSRSINLNSLINSGADVNLKDIEGNTALHLAASKGNFQVLEELLMAGANVNLLNNQNKNPLHMAAINGCVKSIDILYKVCSVTKDSSGHCPLWYSAKNGFYDAVVYFIKTNSYIIKNDFEFQNVSNDPVEAALESRHSLIAKVLLIGGYCDRSVSKWLSNLTVTPWLEDNLACVEWLKKFRCNPKPLKHICRRVIREVLKHRVVYLSSHIQFPSILIRYINLDELLNPIC